MYVDTWLEVIEKEKALGTEHLGPIVFLILDPWLCGDATRAPTQGPRRLSPRIVHFGCSR